MQSLTTVLVPLRSLNKLLKVVKVIIPRASDILIRFVCPFVCLSSQDFQCTETQLILYECSL